MWSAVRGGLRGATTAVRGARACVSPAREQLRCCSLVSADKYRNIAVVAHVDHGKTTLVDALFRSSLGAKATEKLGERAMDTGDLEKERGITILSKVTALQVEGKDGDPVTLNIVDTPGHADFGGEVERILSMVDLVCLLVDATEGPMPQTKFVLKKALHCESNPRALVVINKVDRPSAQLSAVEDSVFNLFDEMGASDEQMDYETIYASGRDGWSTAEVPDPSEYGELGETVGMQPLIDAILRSTPPPKVQSVESEPRFSMLVSMIESDPDVHMGGVMYTGKVMTGKVALNSTVSVLGADGKPRESGRLIKILSRNGLARVELQEAEAGNIVTLVGLSKGQVGDTICDPTITTPFPSIPIDPPTISMLFGPNTSPLAGKSGKKMLARQIVDRLEAEARSNVAVTVGPGPGEFVEVGGRGELQIGILIETLRREGFELSIGSPQVITRMCKETGKELEPTEEVLVDVPSSMSGLVVDKVQARGGALVNMEMTEGGEGEAEGRARVEFLCPSRGLIGLRGELMRECRGEAVVNSVLHSYTPVQTIQKAIRKGSIVSMADGVAKPHSLEALESRGVLFIEPQKPVYNGQVVGESAALHDIEVNPTKQKALTNFRAAGKEDFVRLAAPRKMTLEEYIGYVSEDELIEVTPDDIRLRKKLLDPGSRAREQRAKANKLKERE